MVLMLFKSTTTSLLVSFFTIRKDYSGSIGFISPSPVYDVISCIYGSGI